MTFDFTSIVDRRGKDSIAVDAFGRPGFGPTEEAKARNEEAKKRGEGFDLIPMWVMLNGGQNAEYGGLASWTRVPLPWGCISSSDSIEAIGMIVWVKQRL